MTKGLRPSNRRSTPGYQARQQWQRKVERARQVPIEAVAHALGYGPFETVGNERRARCPFHPDRNPSFFMNPSKGLWHCFGCGASGDVIGIYMRGKGVSFKQAVVELTKRF